MSGIISTVVRRVSSFSVVAGLTVVLFAPLAIAEELVGTWELAVEAQQKVHTPTLAIAHDGNKYTGTISGAKGESQELTDITVDGSNFVINRSFSSPQTGGQPITLTYKGEVDGDTLKGSMTSPRGETPLTGKRVSQ